MIRPLLATAICLATMVSGCKIVRDAPTLTASEVAAADPVAETVAATYAPQLIDFVESGAVEVNTLRHAIATDLAGAGGLQAAGGGAWNFVTAGQGIIVTADRTSRAAHLDIDTDADGVADVQVQLGPVVRGTALRDVAPFYVFTDFRDQIEYAALSRALNERAIAGLVLPDGDLTGRQVDFAGAFALRNATDPVQIVATRLSIGTTP